MVVSILHRVGHTSVGIEGTHPAASVGAAMFCDEVDSVIYELVGCSGPATFLGYGESIDLSGHRPHPLGFVQGSGIETERFVEATVQAIDPCS